MSVSNSNKTSKTLRTDLKLNTSPRSPGIFNKLVIRPTKEKGERSTKSESAGNNTDETADNYSKAEADTVN